MDSRRLPSFERLMIFSASIAFGVLFYRCIFTENLHYTFLLWNLVLAFLPYIISKSLIRYQNNHFKSYLLLFSWLLFFPACIYPLTDLFHLQKTDNFSVYYDVILFLSFAVAGLLPGLLSLKNVEAYLKNHTSGLLTRISLMFFITLSSYSACLVGFLHFKSWNVVADFKRMFSASKNGILDPADHFKIISICILFVLLVDVLYAGFKKITSNTAKIKS